jgi:hypothetical protein
VTCLDIPPQGGFQYEAEDSEVLLSWMDFHIRQTYSCRTRSIAWRIISLAIRSNGRNPSSSPSRRNSEYIVRLLSTSAFWPSLRRSRKEKPSEVEEWVPAGWKTATRRPDGWVTTVLDSVPPKLESACQPSKYKTVPA